MYCTLHTTGFAKILAMLWQGKGCESVTAHLLLIRLRFSAKMEIQNPTY